VIRSTLGELLPSVAELLAPPGRGDGMEDVVLGATPDEIREFALDGLRRRLEIIGLGPPGPLDGRSFPRDARAVG
jgi:hypothetical protein